MCFSSNHNNFTYAHLICIQNANQLISTKKNCILWFFYHAIFLLYFIGKRILKIWCTNLLLKIGSPLYLIHLNLGRALRRPRMLNNLLLKRRVNRLKHLSLRLMLWCWVWWLRWKYSYCWDPCSEWEKDKEEKWPWCWGLCLYTLMT